MINRINRINRIFTYTQKTVKDLVSDLREKRLIIKRVYDVDDIDNSETEEENEYKNKGYQRSFCWKDQTKYKFIESILLGYPIPSILIWNTKENNKDDHIFEVIDGQQRLETLREFSKNLFDLDSKYVSRHSLNTYFISKPYCFSKLFNEHRSKFNGYLISITLIEDVDKDVALKIFIDMNTNAVKLIPHEVREAANTKNNNNSKMLYINNSLKDSIIEAAIFNGNEYDSPKSREYLFSFYLFIQQNKENPKRLSFIQTGKKELDEHYKTPMEENTIDDFIKKMEVFLKIISRMKNEGQMKEWNSRMYLPIYYKLWVEKFDEDEKNMLEATKSLFEKLSERNEDEGYSHEHLRSKITMNSSIQSSQKNDSYKGLIDALEKFKIK